jgi:hypothetical protein
MLPNNHPSLTREELRKAHNLFYTHTHTHNFLPDPNIDDDSTHETTATRPSKNYRRHNKTAATVTLLVFINNKRLEVQRVRFQGSLVPLYVYELFSEQGAEASAHFTSSASSAGDAVMDLVQFLDPFIPIEDVEASSFSVDSYDVTELLLGFLPFAFKDVDLDQQPVYSPPFRWANDGDVVLTATNCKTKSLLRWREHRAQMRDAPLRECV